MLQKLLLMKTLNLRSLKARLVSALVCAVYSLFISPVFRLQSRATLSELAESKY